MIIYSFIFLTIVLWSCCYYLIANFQVLKKNKTKKLTTLFKNQIDLNNL